MLSGCAGGVLKAESPDDVVSAWEEKFGSTCQRGGADEVIYAESSTTCTPDATVSYYQDEKDLRDHVEGTRDLLRNMDASTAAFFPDDITWVTGENWGVC